MAVDLLEQQLGRGVLGKEHGRRPHGKRKEQVGAGRVAEEELGHGEDDVALTVAHRPFRVQLRGVRVGQVRLHHRLGPAGGASGEQPQGRIVAVGGLVLEDVGDARRQFRERGVRAGVPVHHEQVLQAAGMGAGRREGLEARRGDHSHRRPRIFEDGADLLRLELRVQHHRHRADLEDAEERLHVRGTVGEGHHHPLLGLDPQAAQDVAEAVGQGLDLAVVEPAIAADEGRAPSASFPHAVVEEVVGEVERLRRVKGHGGGGLRSRGRRRVRPLRNPSRARCGRSRRPAGRSRRGCCRSAARHGCRPPAGSRR